MLARQSWKLMIWRWWYTAGWKSLNCSNLRRLKETVSADLIREEISGQKCVQWRVKWVKWGHIHNMAEQKNFITFNSQIIQKMAPKLAWKGCMSVQKNYHVPKRVCVSVKDLFPVINSIDIWHDINAITDNFEQCSCFRKFQSCWGQQRDGKLATKRR